MTTPDQQLPPTINLSQALPSSDYKVTVEPAESDEDAQVRRRKDSQLFIVALVLVCSVFVVW
jgi:hypothetical protein